MLKDHLSTHIDTAYGSLGKTQEGVGYKSYTMGFLLPAVIALQTTGDSSLYDQLAAKKSWLQMMHMGSFSTNGINEDVREMPQYLQSGVGGTVFFEEGWSSLELAMVPADRLPYYLYFYDRLTGLEAARQPMEKFDNNRAGTTWALLFYPIGVSAVDPSLALPFAAGDDRGYYFSATGGKTGTIY